jgi:hypothetical protein
MLTLRPFGWTMIRRQGRIQRKAPVSRSLQLEPLESRCLLAADPVLEWNGIALDAIKNDSYLGANAGSLARISPLVPWPSCRPRFSTRSIRLTALTTRT